MERTQGKGTAQGPGKRCGDRFRQKGLGLGWWSHSVRACTDFTLTSRWTKTDFLPSKRRNICARCRCGNGNGNGEGKDEGKECGERTRKDWGECWGRTRETRDRSRERANGEKTRERTRGRAREKTRERLERRLGEVGPPDFLLAQASQD